jgi:hypothetical protein
MSSEQEFLEAQVIQPENLPFNIDDDQWAELTDAKKSWWNHIMYAWDNVKSNAYKRYEYSSINNNIYFIFKSKTSVYKNLLLSLKSYGNVREKVFDKEYYIMIKL